MSVLTVSQLNKYVAFKLNSDIKLKSVMVQGEISNFNNHYKSGHLYFTLKDDSSCIKAVMFSSYATKMKFLPCDGMKVILSGNIEVYERDGVYQIYVTDMQPSGVGGLYLAVEQLKNKLLSEGLFDDKYKKPLPEYPHRIGVVTSSSGAAFHDIVNVLSRRYPMCEVTLYSSDVQGQFAEQSLCANLTIADSDSNDVIIIGRGGGSLEDLMAFNSEKLAYSIFRCKTPVVSAVGHEVDTSISDYVADLSAPTPSAAAELVVPDSKEILYNLKQIISHINVSVTSKLNSVQTQFDNIDNKLINLSPFKKIDDYSGKLDDIVSKLRISYNAVIAQKEHCIDEKIILLNSLNPLAVLSRGYSLTLKDNNIVRSCKEVSEGDEVKIKFADSDCKAVIIKKDV